MRVKAIFVCSQCRAEVTRDYEVADPKLFLKDLLAGGSVPAPLAEIERLVDKDVSGGVAGPVDLIHECDEGCVSVLKPLTVLTYN
jgi:hypothetical protein